MRMMPEDILKPSPGTNKFALGVWCVLWESSAVHGPGGDVHDRLLSLNTLEVHASYMPHMDL